MSRALALSAALALLASVSIARADEQLLAAAQQGHLTVVQELLANGAAVNVPRQDGQTPLHLAAANGHVEIVAALLEAEADFDFQANPGWTPLMLAAAKGHKAIVDMLIAAGAAISNQKIDPLPSQLS